MNVPRLALLSLLLAVAACEKPAPAPAPAPPEPEPEPAAPLPGEVDGASPSAAPVPVRHPRLQATTLDGAAYDLAAQRGKWVLVNFWATWCKPCLQEMPELSHLAESGEVSVIGLAYEEIDDAELRAFIARRPVAYPIAKVDVYQPPADFGAPRGLPTSYLIGPDGAIAKKFLGPVTPEQIRAAMAAPPAVAAP